MDVSEPVMLAVDREIVSPDGKEVSVKATDPEKPTSPVTLTEEVHDAPEAATVRKAGLARGSKSGPITTIGMSTVVVNGEGELLVAFTVTE